jgi:tetratricopeptide (TPR) repeat protein
VAFERAIELDPTQVWYWRNKAHALFDLKRYKEVLPVLEKALRMESENLDLWRNKAVTLRHLWRIREMVQVAAHMVDVRKAARNAAS